MTELSLTARRTKSSSLFWHRHLHSFVDQHSGTHCTDTAHIPRASHCHPTPAVGAGRRLLPGGHDADEGREQTRPRRPRARREDRGAGRPPPRPLTAAVAFSIGIAAVSRRSITASASLSSPPLLLSSPSSSSPSSALTAQVDRPPPSRQRDCRSADAPSPSLLEHLLKRRRGCSRLTKGVQQIDGLAAGFHRPHHSRCLSACHGDV